MLLRMGDFFSTILSLFLKNLVALQSPVRVRRDYGDKNCIGRNVVSLRKEKNIKQKILLAQLQLKGIDIGQSSLSALEGQRREASDREVLALSQIFQVPMERLFQPPEE